MKKGEKNKMEYPVHVHNMDVKDPFILADPASKKYYMYANKFVDGVTPTDRQGTGNTFYAMVSEDLVHWSNPILVFEQNDFWASEDYSGPEVCIKNGKYYLTAAFSAPGTHRKIQALVADGPLGPFVPVGQPLTPDAWECMDGTIFTEKDGQTWLVFAHDWVQVYDGQIAAVPVSDDLTHATGKPVVLFRGSDADWGDDFMYSSQNGGGGAASGPAVYRMADGSLVILWTNQTPYGDAIGAAKSLTDNILGPYEQIEKPIWALGGGHPCLFNWFGNGQLCMALHCGDKESGFNRLLICEMEEYWRSKLPEVVHEFTGNYRTAMGGHAIVYRQATTPAEDPIFTILEDYGGPFAKRKVQWAMAPETKFKKGKIAERD